MVNALTFVVLALDYLNESVAVYGRSFQEYVLGALCPSKIKTVPEFSRQPAVSAYFRETGLHQAMNYTN